MNDDPIVSYIVGILTDLLPGGWKYDNTGNCYRFYNLRNPTASTIHFSPNRGSFGSLYNVTWTTVDVCNHDAVVEYLKHALAISKLI
jgi:hypothetical protein